MTPQECLERIRAVVPEFAPLVKIDRFTHLKMDRWWMPCGHGDTESRGVMLDHLEAEARRLCHARGWHIDGSRHGVRVLLVDYVTKRLDVGLERKESEVAHAPTCIEALASDAGIAALKGTK